MKYDNELNTLQIEVTKEIQGINIVVIKESIMINQDTF